MKCIRIKNTYDILGWLEEFQRGRESGDERFEDAIDDVSFDGPRGTEIGHVTRSSLFDSQTGVVQ
jgi:hypothetical protein